jgi:AcrR family transcriptional regulator
MPRSSRSQTTTTRIVDAALTVLRTEGYAGASVRSIAAAGGFNQALIFYHFGDVESLLLAALDKSNDERMASYRQRLGDVNALAEVLDAARVLYEEDFASGHVKVLAEMMAAGAASPNLGREVARRVEPWLAFTRETIDRVLASSPLAQMIPAGEVAYALAALYLGAELLTNLDGDRTRADALFDSAARVLSFVGPFLTPSGSSR